MNKDITNYTYAELSLVFKEYFDLSKITEALHIRPTSALSTNRTRKNEKLWIERGWEFNSIWTLRTKNIFTYETTDAINELFQIIGDKGDVIREFVSENNGKSDICIVGYYEETYPAIVLGTEIMKKLIAMNTTLEYDLYR